MEGSIGWMLEGLFMTPSTRQFRTILCALRLSELQSFHATAILVIAKQDSHTLPKVRIRTGGETRMSALRDRFLQIQTTDSSYRDSADHRH
ncbi:MAG TPA: hypothetical protein VJ760_10565 [Nitrospiraceae bacterium]|nr:hypothetical protein [Nitrospiraceae bacterium]